MYVNDVPRSQDICHLVFCRYTPVTLLTYRVKIAGIATAKVNKSRPAQRDCIYIFTCIQDGTFSRRDTPITRRVTTEE